MKLKQLAIENFRCFKQFRCEFVEGINVLVGNNGIGKTAILDAVSIGYGQFLSSIATGVDRGVHNDEIHRTKFYNDLDATNFSMEQQFPVKVACSTYRKKDFPESWERERKTFKGRTTQVKTLREKGATLQQAIQKNERVDLPLFAYYGTGRLYAKKKLTAQKANMLKAKSRLEGYRDCMDPDSSYTAFEQWFIQESMADVKRKIQIIEESGLAGAVVAGATLRSKLLSAITNAVNTVLKPSGWENVRYDGGDEGIVTTHSQHGHIPVSMLSDGVRNMIGMIADIAYRCVRLNHHLAEKAALETEGIVLIDEIDMHLHPSWQQTILQNLAEAFPKIQFILTTHSPQVLTTVRKESVHLIQGEGHRGWTVQPVGETYGITSQDVLIELMDVDPQPPIERVMALKEYLRLIDLGEYQSSEGQELWNKLEQLYGENHPELNRVQRKISRKGLLKK